MAFYLYTGNNLDKLAKDVLCKKILSKPLSDPFKKEKIVVQSRGMSAWLKQAIGSYNNICSNVDFIFLSKYVNEIIQQTLPELLCPDTELYSIPVMAWKIFEILEQKESEFKILNNYIDSNNLKQFQLAEKISELFDQYQIYRPDIILKWEEAITDNPDNIWQSVIWQELTRNNISLTGGFRNFFDYSDLSNITDERITIFGISYMPPIFLDFFKKMSEKKKFDVHFFYLNPCMENWEFNLSEKEKDRLSSRIADINISEDELYLNQGNPLLSCYGRAGREFFGAVLNIIEKEEEMFFSDYPHSTILSCIQNDILNNRTDIEFCKTFEKDKSLQIHSCHNPSRELEVLFDNLLDIIENDNIQPRDILVMTPDISLYTSYIKAVFDSKNKELNSHRGTLPYSLSDASVSGQSKIMKSFFDILSLNKSKFKISEIIDILETKAVYSSFNIDDSELSFIRKWAIESGIRWGIDKTHRKEVGVPAFEENSLEFGLSRMLLGYSLEENDNFSYNDFIPYNDIEISGAELLGNFSDFLNKLIDVRNSLKRKMSIKEWVKTLTRILELFFLDNNENYKELVEVRKLIESLETIQGKINISGNIDFEVIKYFLMKSAGNSSVFEGFLRGKITFCTMQPMRSVPSKVICLLGLNEGVFPREDKKIGFNIIDSKIRVCDKSKMLEDRYIFLENIMSAQKYLYLSYIGRNNKTNEVQPPSVAVSELIDYIDQYYGKIAKEQILYNEKLHGFSEVYLNGESSKYFTFSPENLNAAEKCREPKRDKTFAFSHFKKQQEINYEIPLNEFISFFKNPCKYFLTQSAGAKFNINNSEILKDSEPIDFDGLDKYSLNKNLLDLVLNDTPEEDIYKKFIRLGNVPLGKIGRIKFDEQLLLINNLCTKTVDEDTAMTFKGVLSDSTAEYFTVDLESFTFECEFDYLTKNKEQVFIDIGKLDGKRMINAWIKHLALNLKYSDKKTYCIFKDCVHIFPGIKTSDESLNYMKKLIAVYLKGIMHPLPLFPKTSYVYASAVKKKIDYAKKCFVSNDFVTNEDNDFFIRLCYNEGLLFSNNTVFEEFVELAQTVYGYFWKEEVCSE